MAVQMSETVTDLVVAVDKLRADDRLVVCAAQQLAEIEVVKAAITSLQALLVRRVRQARAVNAPEQVCGRTTKGWLHEELCMSGAEVSRYLRCVFRLGAYRLVQDAFDTAVISLPHVLAILTALDKLPVVLRDTLEPLLVEHARTCPPEDIAGFVDTLLDGLGIGAAADARRERRLAERGVDLHSALDGTKALSGTLTPEVGDALTRALERAAPAGGVEDDRTARQRRHDALGVIAAHFLGADLTTPSFTGAPRTVIITLDLQTLEDQLREQWITLPDGATISAAAARQLACDAGLIPAVLAGPSEILDIGQAGHAFTVAQRRAAWLRDGGRCAFPDCRAPVVELHHITYRRHGGPNTLDNAAWVCAFHHWLIHQDQWTLHRDPVDKSYLWTGPHQQRRRRHLRTA